MSRLRAKSRRSLCRIDQLAPADVAGSSAAGQHEAQAEKAPDPFRSHGGGGDSRDAPVAPQHQGQRDHDIDNVDRRLQQQGGSGMLLS